MYKACIFDLDGTLTDTLESLTYSVNETLKELELNTISSSQCQQFVGNGARVLLEKSLKVAGDTELIHIDKAMDIYGRIFEQNCMFGVKPYEGACYMLQELQKLGIYMGVLSNKPHKQAIHVVEKILGMNFFRHVQGQCEEIPRKPHLEGTLYVINKLGVKPEECIYVGDSEVDIATGKAAALETIGVTWGFRQREELVAEGATTIVDTMEELLNMIKSKV